MPEKTAIVDALVVTGDRELTTFPKGHVLLEGNRVVNVGEGPPPQAADRTIDGSGCVVIPGLIVAHTHLYGVLLRGAPLDIEPPTDFMQVLQRVWWPADEALTVEDARASAMSAAAEMLRSGCTFFADTYSGPSSIDGSLDAIARAITGVGMRGMIAFEATERNDPEEGRRGLLETERFARSVSGPDALVQAMVSVHASFTVSDELIAVSAEKARELGIPLTVHASEGLVDVYHNLERYGQRTVERLDRLSALCPSTVLAHCVHVNGHELDLIARTGTSVAHNPMSNMLNAVGTAPLREMLCRKVNVGLGNDGWVFDPFENMRAALVQHRLATGNPSATSTVEVFRMATLWGARCYGLEDRIGSIEPGKLADIVVLDASRTPTPVTCDNVIDHMVHTFSGRDVRHVFVDGVQTVADGALTKVEDRRVAEVSRTAAQAFWDRLRP